MRRRQGGTIADFIAATIGFMQHTALDQQLTFLREIDRLKAVVRQSPLLDQSRKENSAEHSWHLAMYAMLLGEHAATPIDMQRVMKMLLIHDVVEIDVGDTPIHSGASLAQQAELEQKAAQRLFGILPAPQRMELLALWQEFEAATSDDAKFAKALDRIQPLLVNVFTNGGTWSESGVTLEQVLQRYGPTIERGSPALWQVCQSMVREHFQKLQMGGREPR
jgi:putative hydrolase of HD superfamily